MMKLFIFLVFALTVFARESLLRSIIKELAEEKELAGNYAGQWNGHQKCSSAIISPNGKSKPRGCAGAVWSNGNGSEDYCKGGWSWGRAKYAWYDVCCTWNASSKKCVRNADGEKHIFLELMTNDLQGRQKCEQIKSKRKKKVAQ